MVSGTGDSGGGERPMKELHEWMDELALTTDNGVAWETLFKVLRKEATSYVPREQLHHAHQELEGLRGAGRRFLDCWDEFESVDPQVFVNALAALSPAQEGQEPE